MHQRHQVQQEIRGSVVEGSAVRPSGFPNSGVLTQTLKPLKDKVPRGNTRVGEALS